MKKPLIVALIFSAIGILFSGFLTLQKFTSGVCVLTEGCSYLFGIPTCLYGFVLFSLIMFFSIISISNKKCYIGVLIVSLAGVLFSLYYSYLDLSRSLLGYTLGLPSCVYGLFMFIIILVSSGFLIIKK